MERVHFRTRRRFELFTFIMALLFFVFLVYSLLSEGPAAAGIPELLLLLICGMALLVSVWRLVVNPPEMSLSSTGIVFRTHGSFLWEDIHSFSTLLEEQDDAQDRESLLVNIRGGSHYKLDITLFDKNRAEIIASFSDYSKGQALYMGHRTVEC